MLRDYRGITAGAAALLLAISLAVGEEDKTTSQPTPSEHRAVIIPIHDEINDVTLTSLKRRVEQAREEGKTLLVLEMDTPGGLASSALEICTYIKNVTDLRTVAWVKPSAFSAGAMISLACEEVVMASASKLGDCAPIIISPTEGVKELGETERAKAESPILKEFIDSAHRRHYDPLLSEAMVRLGYEIWWLENGPGGERRFVLKRDKEKLEAEEGSTWRPVKGFLDPVSGDEIAVRQPVVEERDLLTLTQSEAVAFGFAKAIVSTEEELRKHYGIAGGLTRFESNWAEDVADFLSSPIVRAILMMMIALGLYAEFQAPGHFVGAAVALVALLIFLGAPYLTGLADVWEILLVGLGLILLGVELFILPGFGIAGVAGILLLLVGFIATFVPADPGPVVVPRLTPGTVLGLKTGTQVVFGGIGLSLVGMWLLNKYLPRLPGARGLILPPAPPTGLATAGLGGASTAGSSAMIAGKAVCQLGDAGVTLTVLRPAGKAQINGRRTDVISNGQVIEEGQPVEVIETLGGRIVVREIRRA